MKTFKVRYDNPDSRDNGAIFEVYGKDHYPNHFVVCSQPTFVAKKYCFRLEEETKGAKIGAIGGVITELLSAQQYITSLERRNEKLREVLEYIKESQVSNSYELHVAYLRLQAEEALNIDQWE